MARPAFPILVFPVLFLLTAQIAHAETGINIPAWDRGYVEAWNHLPVSSHDANYTSGYNSGTHDFPLYSWAVHPGSLPSDTNDNYNAFYAGFHHGMVGADQAYSGAAPGPKPIFDNHNNLLCPPGHTSEYCAGYIFGYNIEDMANDPPNPANLTEGVHP